MTRKAKPPVPLYSALADTTRCRIVEILVDGPIPVHRLADAFAISRPAISRHLRVLKEAGLVAEVKKGRENLYALRAEKLSKGLVWISAMADAAAVSAKPKKPKPIAAPPKPVATLKPKPAKVEPPRPVAQSTPDPAPQMGFDF